MTELLNRPESQENDTPDTATLQEMFNAQDSESNNLSIDQQYELPTQASLLDRAVNRINKFATSRAHGKALKEYRARDYDGYISHLANVADSTEATPMAKATAEMAIEREWRREDREKMIEKGTEKVRGFGRSVIAHLKGVGEITLGIGLASAEVAGRGVKKTAEAAKTGTAKFGEKVGDGFIAGMKKVESGMDATGTKIETIKQNLEANKMHKEALVENRKRDEQHENALKMNEKFDRVKKRKDAALVRKQARHRKWTNLKTGLKEYNGYVKEGLVETKERAKRKARIYRSAGRQALATYRDAIAAHK
ncbi:MAG TPA: hypothetical protein VGE13_03940 [Candidatus Saccharimonadales bacterium]